MTPTTPTTGPQSTSRPRDDDRPTRKPLALWDRVKYLLLLAALFGFFVWADMADNPLLPFVDAVEDEVRSKWWILLLAGIEVVRQVHYLISEHWAAYHRFWTTKVFGGVNRLSARMSDLTRYRIARRLKVVLFHASLLHVIRGLVCTSAALSVL